MPSASSPNKAFELQATGEHNGTWGVALNAVISLIDQIMGNTSALDAAAGSAAITTGQLDTFALVITGTLAADITYTFPAVGGYFMVDNKSTGAHSITFARAGRSYVVPQGRKSLIFCDGTNVDPVITPAVTHCGTTGGTATAYTATIPGNVTGYSTGLALMVVLNATCGATPTINFSTLGAKKMYRAGATAVVQITTSELGAGQSLLMVYDATLDSAAGGFFVVGAELTGTRTITVDATLTKTGGPLITSDVNISMPNVGTAGTTGDSTHVAQITTDAQGRVSSATAVAINVVSVLGYTPVNRAGDTMSGNLVFAAASKAAANTMDMTGIGGNRLTITGNTTINTWSNLVANSLFFVDFTGTPIVTNGATNIVPGGTRTMAAGDTGVLYATDATHAVWLNITPLTGKALVFTTTDYGATQLQMEGRAANSVYATPQVMKYDPGVGKVAVAFGPGASPTIFSNLNVASIARNSTGNYTVTYTAGFSGATAYVPVPGLVSPSLRIVYLSNQTATTIDILCKDTGGTSRDDFDALTLICMGDF